METILYFGPSEVIWRRKRRKRFDCMNLHSKKFYFLSNKPSPPEPDIKYDRNFWAFLKPPLLIAFKKNIVTSIFGFFTPTLSLLLSHFMDHPLEKSLFFQAPFLIIFFAPLFQGLNMPIFLPCPLPNINIKVFVSNR